MKKIKVYSTPICSLCVVLKNFLKDNNIEFEDINVSEDDNAAKQMVEKSGQMEVPVIDIDGQIIVGFDQKKIKKLLNIK